MGDSPERIAVIEQRIDTLNEWTKDLNQSIKDSTKTTHEALAKLTEAVHELAAMKSDHERHSTEISSLRQRQHALGNELTRISNCETKINYLEDNIRNLVLKVERILQALPNIEMASGWVFKAALFVLTCLGTVALGVILKGGV